MKLSDYLTWQGLKPYQFAKEHRLGFGLVYALKNGERINLKLSTIQKIHEATGGNVGLADLS